MVEFDADFQDLEDEITAFRLTNNAAVLDCIEKMEKNWTLKMAGFRSNCFSLLYKIFYILELAGAAKYISSDKYQILQPALLYLKENIPNRTLPLDI